MSGARQVALLCARQELLLALRSRWTQIFACVFAGLSLAVAASGYILTGGWGFQDFARTAASLVQLVLLLVPVTSLLIGVLALAPERGAADLLFAQPVGRGSVLLGRMAGLWAALAAAQGLGFGAAGVVIFWRSGEEGLRGFLILVAGSLLLTALFLGLAALIGSWSVGRRSRSLAVALVVWFVAVVLFDVAALGVASLLPSGSGSRVLIVSVLVNPVDAARTATLLGIQGTTAFGEASLAFLRFTRGPVRAGAYLALSLAIWTLLPAWLAIVRVRRIDL